MLEDAGGWPERSTAYHFAEYADAVAAALGDRVKHWATLNEPYCSSHFGYATGIMAPGRASVEEGFAAAHHLLLGHGLAIERLRDRVPDGELGIVINFGPQHPASTDAADVAAASVKDALFNRWFVEPIAGLGYPIDATGDVRWSGAEIHDGDLDIIATPIDVLGVNYYTRSLIDAGGEHVAALSAGDGDGLGDLSGGTRRDAALAAHAVPLPALPHHRERGGDGRPSRRHRVRRRPGSHRLHPPSPCGRPPARRRGDPDRRATSHGA